MLLSRGTSYWLLGEPLPTNIRSPVQRCETPPCSVLIDIDKAQKRCVTGPRGGVPKRFDVEPPRYPAATGYCKPVAANRVFALVVVTVAGHLHA